MTSTNEQIAQINEPMVLAGTYPSQTTGPQIPNNGAWTLQGAAKFTRETNTVDELHRRFLDNTADRIYDRVLSNGDVVLTIRPIGPYADGAAAVFAFPRSIVERDDVNLVDGRLPTLSIYQLDPETQREYWKQALCVQEILEAESAKRFGADWCNEDRIVISENAAAYVSDEIDRVARTVIVPHCQIFRAKARSAASENVPKRRDLERERQVTMLLGTSVARGLKTLQHVVAGLARRSYELQLAIRNAAPYGYVLTTPLHRDMPLSQRAEGISAIMREHHELYEASAAGLLADAEIGKEHSWLQKHLISQPSYKVFMTYNSQGFLEISISPTLFSSAGVTEVIDRNIPRGPEYESIFPTIEDRETYYAQLSEKVKQKMTEVG